jgi:hypothetical protein
MSVAAGLTATKAGLDVAKLLMDRLATPNVDVNDIRAKVQEMLIHVVNAQVALGEAQVEISELRKAVEDREEMKAIEASLEFSDELYWRRKADRTLDGPYCPTCWDDTRKLIRLEFYEEGEWSGLTTWPGRRRKYRCVLHKTVYYPRAEMWGPNKEIR